MPVTGIFDELPANPAHTVLKEAALAVVQRLKQVAAGTGGLRLGELGTAEEDFEWLTEWVWQLDEDAALRYLHFDAPLNSTEEHQYQRALAGTLLLLYAAEYLRRGLPAAPGWCLPDAKAFPEAVSAKFWVNGEPSPLYLWALGEAAKRLKLRENNGHSEISFLTFPLIALHQPALFNDFLLGQIGLTATQLREDLPGWVTNDETPPPVSALLDETHGSQTFRQTWEAMRAYHRAELSAEGLRQQLSQSPWILPAWAEPLVEIIPILPAPVIEAEAAPPAAQLAPELPPVFVPIAPAMQATAAAPYLDVFGPLFPYGGVKTVMKAVRTLVKQLTKLQLGERPFSLAELRLTDYDYLWLRVWVKQLEAHAVAYCQTNKQGFWADPQKPSFQAGLGLLLLLWLSETARREAVEGELWPFVAEGYFKSEVNETLFSQGHSSAELRALMRAAVQQFKLRNVLEEPNVQRWLDTVFLQFGFTKQGFQKRLSEWLAGQATTRSVAALLDDGTGSPSFKAMWEELRTYRRGQLPEAQLRTTLADTAWVLPEWSEDLLVCVTAAPGFELDEPASSPAPESFVSAPVLYWPAGNVPQFVCQLQSDLLPLGLTESSYDVCVGGQVQAQLLRQAEGHYLPVPSRYLSIPFDQATSAVSLRNEAGETVSECELELWPGGEDVAVYRFPSGGRLADAFTQTLSPNVSYGLLLAADLVITPAPAEWRRSASQAMILYRLNPGWAANTQVHLDGELLWEPTVKAATGAPNWADIGIFLHDTQSVKWGQEFRVKIIHRPEVSIRYLRCQGRALTLKPVNQTTTLTEALTVGLDLTTQGLEFRIGLERDGQRCAVQRTLNLNGIGAAHLQAGVWRVLNSHSVLTVEQARRDLFKIMLPAKWEGQHLEFHELALVEGESTCHPRPPLNGKLGTLKGWGASLRLRPLFNAAPATFLLNLAGSVVNYGLLNNAICEATPDQQARLLRLSFNHALEPSEQHAVIWWDVNGQLISLAPKAWDEADGAWWWVCEVPETCTRPLAVAVAYQGVRQGAHWEDRLWIAPLAQLMEQDARRTAALLRWFQLPLLSPEAKPSLREFVNTQPVACLRAWLLDEGLPGGLELVTDGECESWLAVVRSLFQHWHPTPTQAIQTLQALADVETALGLREYLADAVNHLMRVDPMLMAKVLRGWEEPQKAPLLQDLQLEIAQCSSTARLNQREQKILSQAAHNLSLNEATISNGILRRAVQHLRGETIDETAKRNLAVAARIPDLRRLLALRLLAHI